MGCQISHKSGAEEACFMPSFKTWLRWGEADIPWQRIPKNWGLSRKGPCTSTFQVHSKVSERENKAIWRVSKRTDSRRGKVAECPRSTGMEELLVWRKYVLLQEFGGVSSGKVRHSHYFYYGRTVGQHGSVFYYSWVISSSMVRNFTAVGLPLLAWFGTLPQSGYLF